MPAAAAKLWPEPVRLRRRGSCESPGAVVSEEAAALEAEGAVADEVLEGAADDAAEDDEVAAPPAVPAAPVVGDSESITHCG